MNSLVLTLLLAHELRFGGAAILRQGTPLWWAEAVSSGALSWVRSHGVTQFWNHYQKVLPIETPSFVWGDEVEYGVFYRDPASGGHYDLSLRGADIIEMLEAREPPLEVGKHGCDWQPEYGSWMVECVPRLPYGGYVSDLFQVERSMQLRRCVRINFSLAPFRVKF
jgi:glutamate--cysteine ligase catalytic subunit